MTPSSSPTAGAHAIAAATVARGSVGGAGFPAISVSGSAACASRHGITVSSVTDSLRPVPFMMKEPIGRRPKDVLS